MAIRTEVQRALNKVIKEAAVVADLSGVKEKTRSALLQSCFKTTDTVKNSIAKNTDAVCGFSFPLRSLECSIFFVLQHTGMSFVKS